VAACRCILIALAAWLTKKSKSTAARGRVARSANRTLGRGCRHFFCILLPCAFADVGRGCGERFLQGVQIRRRMAALRRGTSLPGLNAAGVRSGEFHASGCLYCLVK